MKTPCMVNPIFDGQKIRPSTKILLTNQVDPADNGVYEVTRVKAKSKFTDVLRFLLRMKIPRAPNYEYSTDFWHSDGTVRRIDLRVFDDYMAFQVFDKGEESMSGNMFTTNSYVVRGNRDDHETFDEVLRYAYLHLGSK